MQSDVSGRIIIIMRPVMNYERRKRERTINSWMFLLDELCTWTDLHAYIDD